MPVSPPLWAPRPSSPPEEFCELSVPSRAGAPRAPRPSRPPLPPPCCCPPPARRPSNSTPATRTSACAGTTPSATTWPGGWRRDSKIGNSPISDEGTYSFDRGDLVANRLDLLSEFDLVWKKRYGFRVSGAGWYDDAYGNKGAIQTRRSTTSRATSATTTARWSSACTTARPAKSSTPSCSAASTSATCRSTPRPAAIPVLGRVAVPGRPPAQDRLRPEPAGPAEGLRDAGHRGQGTVPSAEPAVRAGAGDRDFSFAASTCSSGNRRAIPKAAPTWARWTSRSTARTARPLSLPLGFAPRQSVEPDQRGEFGLSARWSPHWLDGTLGFYYRNFADKLPQTF